MAQTHNRRAQPPSPQDDHLADRCENLEGALVDAERIMMQTVQTSLSLIGFGFSITEFFSSGGPVGRGTSNARIVGEALLVLGLLLLAMGIWSHARYRAHLVRQIRRTGAGPTAFGLRYRDTPTFIIAVLLLVVGLFTFVSVFVRRLF